jgi:hypothetical protein
MAAESDTVRWEIPRGTMAAVGLHFHGGPERDPVGREGATWLVAQAMRAEIARRVGVAPDHVIARIEPGRTTLVAQVPSDQLDEAREVVRQVVFRDPIPRGTLETVRSRTLDQLRFQEGAPLLGFQTELARFLYGTDSPWTHSVLGNSESVAALDPADVPGLARMLFPEEDAHWAVVTAGGAEPPQAPVPSPGADLPGDPDTVDALEGRPGAPPGTDTTAAATQTPSPQVSRWQPAWTTSDRLAVSREITNTWVAVAYPLDPGLTFAQRLFLSRALEFALEPQPPDPGLFDARVWIQEGPAGPLLILEAAVFPEDAIQWEARILDTVEGMAETPPQGAFFSFLVRRYRTERALLASDPGEAAFALLEANHLRVSHRGPGAPPPASGSPSGQEISYRSLLREVPDRDGLADTARRLGPPRILVFGPDISEGPASRTESPLLDGSPRQ